MWIWFCSKSLVSRDMLLPRRYRDENLEGHPGVGKKCKRCKHEERGKECEISVDMVTGRMPHPKTGTTVLCEPAQSKRTWTCHGRHFMRKNTRNMLGTRGWTLALTLTVRTPQCGNTCFGELPKRIDYTGLTLLWLSCSLQEPTKRKNAQYRFSFFCCYSLKFSWPYWQKCSVHLVVVVFTCLHIKNVFRIFDSVVEPCIQARTRWGFLMKDLRSPLWWAAWQLVLKFPNPSGFDCAFQRGNGKLEIRPDSGTYRLALFREETENLR